MTRSIAATVLLAACAARPVVRPRIDFEQPAITDPLRPPLTLGRSEADAYDGAPSPGTAEEPLFERLRGALHEDPIRDARLDAAASALARLAGDAALTRSATERALYDHGVAQPVIGVAIAAGDDVDALVRQLQPLRGYGRASVGIGRAGGHVVVVLARAPFFRLAPAPRELPVDGHVEVVGTLDPALRAPVLAITRDDGRTERTPFTPIDGRYAALFACSGVAGRRWVTIEALDGAGVEQRLVYAPIDCGAAPASVYRVEPAANLRGRPAARALAAIINRERRTAGLPPLRGDLRALAAATRRLADPRSSLRDLGLQPVRQGSVGFHADSLAEAAELVLNHPALRDLLLRGDLTHLGLATRLDPQGGLDVALEAIEVPVAIDVPAVTAGLVAGVRRAALPARLARSRPLTAIARWYASQLAHGWNASSLADHVQALVEHAGLRDVHFVVRTPERLADLDPAALVAAHPRFVGLAVAQAARDGALAGRIYVVILFGR